MKGTILGIRDSVHFVFSRAGQTHPTPFDRFQRPIGHRQRDSDRPQVQFSNGSNPFEPTLFKPLSTRRWPLNFSEVVVVTAPPQLWPSVLPAFSAQIFWRVTTGATRASIPPGCKDPPVSFSRRPI